MKKSDFFLFIPVLQYMYLYIYIYLIVSQFRLSLVLVKDYIENTHTRLLSK